MERVLLELTVENWTKRRERGGRMKKHFVRVLLIMASAMTIGGCASKAGTDTAGENVQTKEEVSEEFVDFTIEVEEGRDVRVLQLTDTEIIDSTQKRTEDRLVGLQYTMWQPQNMDMRCFKHIREAIKRADPDFIILTGDFVYGEFDDNGTSLEALIKYMDSFEIPWSPVFGDLERESAKGADWQCEQLEKSEYCYFKRGNTDGDGNYSVGIKQGDEYVRVFYMIDGNTEFTEKRMDWLYDKMTAFDEKMDGKVVNASLCYHHPTTQAVLAGTKYADKRIPYTINENVKGEEGDFGSQFGDIGGLPVPDTHGMDFVELLHKFHVDSVFMGHFHEANTSINYEGIRWTFGLKSSEYGIYEEKLLGGTQITFNKTELNVEHLYADTEYEEYLKNMDYY